MMMSSNGNIFRGEFPSQRPVTQSFAVFFDFRLNKRWSKQTKRRWFETPSRSLWRHCNVTKESGLLVKFQKIIIPVLETVDDGKCWPTSFHTGKISHLHWACWSERHHWRRRLDYFGLTNSFFLMECCYLVVQQTTKPVWLRPHICKECATALVKLGSNKMKQYTIKRESCAPVLKRLW